MRLNDWLTLVVSGVCKAEIEQELGVTDTAPGVTIKDNDIRLALNDVTMQ